MKSLLRFNKYYFILAIAIFIAEVLIALFAHDQFIRPYFGDLLVVILIYCFVKAFLDTPATQTAVAVLGFSFLVETMQYFKIIDVLGLQHSGLARTIIGTSAEWTDLFAYTCGIGIVLLCEYRCCKNQQLR